MKIIGYRRSDFVTKEGRPVTGCRIYLATEIASQNLMGREVKIFYNEYRKPENIVVLD